MLFNRICEEAKMNKSEVLKALEWVDKTAKDGDALLLAKAKLALEVELASQKSASPPAEAYSQAVESFTRKHGRAPLEDIMLEEE
jgi:hypothetical protein